MLNLFTYLPIYGHLATIYFPDFFLDGPFTYLLFTDLQTC